MRRDLSKIRNYRVGGILSWHMKRRKVNPGDEGQIERTTIMETFKKVTMKLTCGPVTDYIGGVKSTTNHKGDVQDYIQKNIILNAVYGKPEDNNYAQATPSGKLEFSLTNPGADIFVPGKQYKITLEEWSE